MADAPTVLPSITNITGTKRNANFVIHQIMGVAALIATKKTIGMELVVTNADGVVLATPVVDVLIARQRFMRDKFMDMNH